jgi:hypothetical protein
MAINVQVGSGSGLIINLSPGSGSTNQDYGSVDPDPQEIFTDPENCCSVTLKIHLMRADVQD